MIVLRAQGRHFSAGHDLDTTDKDAVQLAEADGSFRLDKWKDAENKIQELVDDLFPDEGSMS